MRVRSSRTEEIEAGRPGTDGTGVASALAGV